MIKETLLFFWVFIFPIFFSGNELWKIIREDKAFCQGYLKTKKDIIKYFFKITIFGFIGLSPFFFFGFILGKFLKFIYIISAIIIEFSMAILIGNASDFIESAVDYSEFKIFVLGFIIVSDLLLFFTSKKKRDKKQNLLPLFYLPLTIIWFLNTDFTTMSLTVFFITMSIVTWYKNLCLLVEEAKNKIQKYSSRKADE